MKAWLELDVEVEYIRGVSTSTVNKIPSEIRRRGKESLDQCYACERKSR